MDTSLKPELEGHHYIRCRRCHGDMRPGIALVPTWRGVADFGGGDVVTFSAGGGDVVTFSAGGPGRVIPCAKCVNCGYSVTLYDLFRRRDDEKR